MKQTRLNIHRTPENADAWLWGIGERTPAGCLLCKSLTTRGYAKISYNHHQWKAHRIAWTIAFGPIPEGLHVCHKCDVRNCYEPSHLFLGTHADNMRDMTDKGRHRGCPPRHKGGESHPAARLTDLQVVEIRASSESYAVLAARYSTSKSYIWELRHHHKRPLRAAMEAK